MKILLIGNSGIINNYKDGQTTKLRLYKKIMEQEGCDVAFIDLERFFRRPFSILRQIKKQIRVCDRIVLISGERACKLLIPFINKHNKKCHKPFILPVVGSGVLHFSIDHLKDEGQVSFIVGGEYSLGKRQKKIERELKKITYILPETELMKKVYSEYYKLDNCVVLNNFRDFDEKVDNHQISSPLKLVFLSRVMRLKGIFELIEAVKSINKNVVKLCLDIYGDKSLSDEDLKVFNNSLDEQIIYKGSIDNNEVIQAISKYDLFVFPTNAVYEGTPGVIAESLIAGTPVLSSNFPQAKYLLKDGYDSILFKMFDIDDLKDKLMYCLNNKELLNKMRKNALESGKKYLYKHEREKFLKYVCGMEEE